MIPRSEMARRGRAILTSLGLLIAGAVQGQGLPATQVWLLDLADGLPAGARMISAATGYNNQPLFSADGRYLYFTSERDGGQTDIAQYDLASGEAGIVAASPESEYSPTPIPGQAALSVVRVEADGRQRLWRLDLATHAFSLLLPNVEPVGYHSWYAQGQAALFVLGDSFTLHRARVGDEPSERMFDNIGRTLRGHLPTGRVLFVDKNTEPWSIAALDTGTGEARIVMPLFPGVEDFEVDRDGRFWMGSGGKLYRSDPAHRRWRLAADLTGYGIANITRLGASPDGSLLAVVSTP